MNLRQKYELIRDSNVFECVDECAIGLNNLFFYCKNKASQVKEAEAVLQSIPNISYTMTISRDNSCADFLVIVTDDDLKTSDFDELARGIIRGEV